MEMCSRANSAREMRDAANAILIGLCWMHRRCVYINISMVVGMCASGVSFLRMRPVQMVAMIGEMSANLSMMDITQKLPTVRRCHM
jgi:hypothetical protein